MNTLERDATYTNLRTLECDANCAISPQMMTTVMITWSQSPLITLLPVAGHAARPSTSQRLPRRPKMRVMRWMTMRMTRISMRLMTTRRCVVKQPFLTNSKTFLGGRNLNGKFGDRRLGYWGFIDFEPIMSCWSYALQWINEVLNVSIYVHC